MELKHLRTLIAIKEQKSFTQAARALGVTQAAVSQHVACLERELDVSLFDRRARKIELTENGRRLCNYAERILRLVEEAVAGVKDEASAVSGTLYIAASTVPSATLLPKLLSDFQELHPAVLSKCRISESRTAVEAVESGNADVGFVGVKPETAKLESQPVAADELVLVVAPDHPLAQRRSLSLKQLADVPLIVREANSGSRSCLEAALAEHGYSLAGMNIAMEINTNDGILAAVKQGSGAAFLSKASIGNDVKSGELAAVKVRSLRPRRQLYLIHRRAEGAHEPLRSFLDFVSDATG